MSRPIPSQKLSGVFHTPLISSRHTQPGHSSSLQPDARETSHSKLKEPSEKFMTAPPCSPDKPRGRSSDSHSHCWMAASSNRHAMGHSHKRPWRRAVFLAPGVSSFPRKQISCSSAFFWQPLLRPTGENSKVPGQELAPGLSPASHAKLDVTACLRQLLIRGMAQQRPFLAPHVCSKCTSSHGKTCLQTSQARTDLAIGAFKYETQRNQ